MSNGKNHDLAIKEQALEKIDFLLTKKIVTEEELYHFVKEFFKRYLHIDYEFTYEELEEELAKVFIDEDTREMLDKFLEEVSFIEFSDLKFTSEEIKELLKTFALIIDIIIPEELPPGSPGRALIERIKKEKALEMDGVVMNKKEEKGEILFEEEKEALKMFREELNKASIAIASNNNKEARDRYMKALKIYDSLLSIEEKKKVYKELRDLYEAIAS
ncbi:hypothetical protein J7K74_03525 [Candidatus Woesearchaeota archaeon]|nr:hypothetical protein [Candidatus Woesearchaeota archaeon]